MAIVKDKNHNKRFCQEGIIAEYLKYTTGQESPTDFHLWVCIGMIAVALGRNAWLNRGGWNIYPNLFIILIGESGLTRKSTALNLGIHPLQSCLPDITELGQKITPEQLIGVLAQICDDDSSKRAEAYIHASEMAVLLGKTNLDDSLIKLLTDLWDCPSHHTYQTRGKGKETMKDVCINMLAATTPDWLRNSIPQDTLEGGFFSRLILVQRTPTGEKNPFPEDSMNVKIQEALENIKHDLQLINQEIHGPFEWDTEAKKAYATWYCEYNEPESSVSFMRGYYGRKGDFVIKLAMISSANYSNDKIITKEDIVFAVKILNENEVYTRELVKFMGTTFSGKMYVGVLNKIKNSVVSYTNGHGEVKQVIGIEHSRLMRNVGHQMKASELSDVIQGLIDAEEIECFHDGNKRLYRKLGKSHVTDVIKKAIEEGE